MPAKKAVKKTAPKKVTPKKVVRKAPVAKRVTEPVAPAKSAAHGKTWGTLVEAAMKKPRSWADWTARQLSENKLK